jgi:hypothetical protein
MRWRGILVWTAVGLAARAAWLLLEPQVDPSGDEPSWISLGVYGLAKLRHPLSPLRSPLLFYPPAYPYFIATAYLAFHSLRAVLWCQVALGSLLVPAVGRFGTRALSPRAGLGAVALVALYPELIWFSVHFWSETLLLVLVWWAFERGLVADLDGSTAATLAAGALWGLAALTHETPLLFAPVFALWLASSRGHRGRVRAGVFLIAVLLTVAPWTARNWIKYRAFVPVSTFGPLNLWQGNSRLERDDVFRMSDSVADPIGQYHLAWRMALSSIAERQPYWLIEKIVSEVPRFWGLETEPAAFIDRGAYPTLHPGAAMAAKAVLGLSYLLALAGAVLAVARARLGRALLPAAAFLVYSLAIGTGAHALARYRLPLMPLLFLLIGEVWAAFREGRLAPMSVRRWALSAALVLALGTALALDAVARRHGHSLEEEHAHTHSY